MDDIQLNLDTEEILKFLGVEPTSNPDTDEYELYGVLDFIEDGENEQHFFTIEEMKFHEDFNWLMAVVNKIENVGHTIVKMSKVYCEIIPVIYNINYDGMIWHDKIRCVGKNRLEATYEAVVEFIKWYNKKQ